MDEGHTYRRSFPYDHSVLSLTHQHRFALSVYDIEEETFRSLCQEIEESLHIKLLFQKISREMQSSRLAVQCSAKNITAKTRLRVIELLQKKVRRRGGSLSFETMSR
ncbi:MAG: hypothetical protein KDD62_02915 [Bdellovibrionales bacterium]|nr:hypothetical protein [Bdellovibrionales bacterium]